MASRRPSNLSYAEGLIAWHRKTICNDRENRKPTGRQYGRIDEDPGNPVRVTKQWQETAVRLPNKIVKVN
jgi:hypothetical protein